MSAIVCGKRSFFEDLESAAGSSSPPSSYKRFRCSSPARFAYSPPVHSSSADQLKSLFPEMEVQLIEKALEDAGYDMDSAINSLKELSLEFVKQKTGLTTEEKTNIEEGASPLDVAGTPLAEPQLQNNLPADGAAWVDLIVNEMMSATNIDDAKTKAARVLESLEKAISYQAGAKVAEGLHKENMMLKEQIVGLLRDNAILKRAVSIQHERQKEYDERNTEVQQLKQLLGQYQEQLRTLEVRNYGLTMHLRQAEHSNSIPGHFHPDIF